MKTLVLAIMAFYTLFVRMEHDAVMAMFKVEQKADQVQLKLSFDIQDYLSSQNLTKNQVSIEQLKNYLNASTQWLFNDIRAEIIVKEINVQRDHFLADCEFDLANMEINKLVIKNEFLIGVKGHSNIIMMDLKDTFKDYRMHVGRKKIEVTF